MLTFEVFCRTLKELAKEQKRIAAKRNTETPDNKIASKQEQSAISMLEFLDRARNGEMIPPDVIVQYANYFQDDLTLDNMPRMQLINMCKYMGIPPYGADPFLRFQLRHKIRILKEDDQRILWEGIDSLTKMELREACQERGMRSTGLSKEAYKRSLQQWLDLSVDQNVPISLLIMSRTFFLQEEITPDSSDETKGVAGLADAISGLDKEVLNEVILEVATSEEKTSNPDVRKIKLEVLMHQNEKIREEREEREAATKKKGSSEKTEAQEGPQEVSEGTELGSKHSKVSHTDEAKSEEAKLVSKVGTAKTEPIIEDTTVFEMEKETEIKKQTTSEEEKIERDLSAEEMEAISQLLTADPVSKEREDLAKIKSAMKEEGEEELIQEDSDTTVDDASNESARANRQIDAMIEDKRILESDEDAAAAIEDIEKKAALDAEKATTFSTEPGVLSSSISQLEEASHAVEEPNDEGEDEIESDGEEDIIVARLKKRIQTMVDKIELQLSDVQVKIGDKLHILDKDMDGILTKEEMVECLQHVLKREISYEEAMEIAGEMVSLFLWESFLQKFSLTNESSTSTMP